MPARARKLSIAIGVLVVVMIGGIVAYVSTHKTPVVSVPPAVAPVATTTAIGQPVVIGHSVQGRAIEATTYGTGATHLLFVGGMHGGYEWNSVLLAYQLMDYYASNTNAIPADESITIVPDANPDATFVVMGKEGPFTLADVPPNAGAGGVGRLNADNVDLNRNFGCNWAATSTWQNKPESAGTAAFSEPEAQAIRDLATSLKPAAVVFWHSASGTVYAADCSGVVAPQEMAVMNTYAKAAGYQISAVFDAYPITGDSEGWLASIGIPAVTVELTTHTTVEFAKNLAGVTALMKMYQ